MPRYSEQFKRDAVALYENNEDLSLHAASAELGINRSSLYSWLKQYGTGKRARSKNMRDKGRATTDSQRIRQLEKRKVARRTRYPAQGREAFCLKRHAGNRLPVFYDHRTEYSVHTDVSRV